MVCAVSAWILVGNCAAWKMAGEENFIRGSAALRSGDYAAARQYLEAAVNDEPNPEESRAGLLQMFRETGAYQEAAKRSEEFLSARDGSALLHLEKGRIEEAIGDYAGAEKHLLRSIALAPGASTIRMDATRILAALLEEVGRQADARRLWDQLIGEYRAGRVQGSQRLGDVAVAAWHRGYVQDAKDIFLDATDTKRGEVSLEALANFGYLFLDKYDATDALAEFRDCLKINKNYPDALVGIALAKKYDNDFEVTANSRMALKVNPNLVSALNSLAALDIEEENHDKALKEINAALAVNPSNLESLSLLAVYHYFRGDSLGFAKTEKRVLEINPSCGKFYYTLAENLVSRGKYQEAVDFNRKAVALDPELWAAYTSLGMNLTRIGGLEEGRKAIQRAFDGDPFNLWAYNSLELFDQMDTFVRSRSVHFTFRMSREDAPALASYAPELSEEVYEKLTRRYGFKPDGPIQVEIFPDHGGFAVRTLGVPGLVGALGVCFGKVVAIDSPRAHKAGAFNWGMTLWHEFAHVMTLQMTRYNIPRWYTEGLSVYEEHRARPGWGDNLTSSFLKAYKEERLLKASELNSGFLHPQDPEQISLSYYQAALVCEWIEQRFGFEKIRQSLLLFSENKPAEEVFRRTLGLDAGEMDSEYARFIDAHVQEIASHLNFAQPNGISAGDAVGGTDKDAVTRLLQSNPQDFFANLQMGALLQKEGAHAEAEAYLKKAQTLFPQYVEPGNPYQLLGQMYLETKRESDALAQFTAWSRVDGSSIEPLIKAAEIYRKRKDWASAAAMLNLSIYINPYDLDNQKKLGEAAMESGKWTDAITAYRALVALNVTDPAGAHCDLARALLASGNKSEAKREVLRSLEIAPSFIKAQKLLLQLSGEPIE
jgi:tetratricopeptide (TPR) repeat protein